MYRFRPLFQDDLPLIETWLQEPHVRAWWRDPQRQYDLIAGDLPDPKIDLHLVHLADVPFAYLQDYCVQDWMQPHLADLPQGTRAIDLFIGDPNFLGQGHGAGLVRQFAQDLIDAGTPQVVIDPEVKNTRALRAYAKAGFKNLGHYETDEGPVALMGFGSHRY